MTIHLDHIVSFIVYAVLYISMEIPLAIFCLWPVNDKPVTARQKITFVILSTVLAIWWFGYHYGFLHFVK